jgi:hypothetical protein
MTNPFLKPFSCASVVTIFRELPLQLSHLFLQLTDLFSQGSMVR